MGIGVSPVPANSALGRTAEGEGWDSGSAAKGSDEVGDLFEALRKKKLLVKTARRTRRADGKEENVEDLMLD